MAEPTDSPDPNPENEDASSPTVPHSRKANVDGDDAQALESAVDTVEQIRGEADAATQSKRAGESQSAARSLELEEFERDGVAQGLCGIDLLSRVNLNVRIELGRTRMLVEDVLRLNEGSVVELDKLAGDPVDIYVNDRLVACGEVLVLNDAFSVRINDILGKPGSVIADLNGSHEASIQRSNDTDKKKGKDKN